MTLEAINPEDLPTPLTYTHVIVAAGSRLVFVAGQATRACPPVTRGRGRCWRPAGR